MQDEVFYAARTRMVNEQLVRRGIKDPRVLDAMQTLPRHSFVLPEDQRLAYSDGPLPIGYGQTISQPYIVALMIEMLALKGSEVVLEVGTGSGYQAAILAYLAREVHTIERHPGLARQATIILEHLGLQNVYVHVGDGSAGLPEYSPYDAIIVAAAAPNVPHALLDQLAPRGRLVIPIGMRDGQLVERWYRAEDGFTHERLVPVAFVPLIGRFGWREED